MSNCIITGEIKLGKDENNHLFVFIVNQNKWIDMTEFKKCNIDNAKLIIQTDYVKLKKEIIKENKSFNDTNSYNLISGQLMINDYGISETQEQLIQPEVVIVEENEINKNISDIFTPFLASLALVLSVAQQIKQKKKETESEICCNNNKLEISKFDAKLQKLETEIKANAQKEKKSLIAEIIETRKELKEIKDDFNEITDVIEKIIDEKNNSKEKK